MSTEDHYAEYDEDDQHADIGTNNSNGGNLFGSFGKKNSNANVNIHNLASSSVLSLPEDSAGASSSPYNEGNEESNYSTGVSTGHFFEQPPKNSFTYNADLEHSGSNIQLSVVDSDSARQHSEQHQDGVSEALLAWKHIDSWCTENAPDLSASLDNPCTRNDITGAEQDLNISFPPSVRASLRIHDGQEELDSYSGVSGLIYGLPLMSLDNIVSMTFAWRNVATNLQKSQKLKQESKIFDSKSSPAAAGQPNAGGENFKLKEIPKQGSIPPNTVQPVYAHHGWVPLVTDNAGNHIAIDLAPAPEGKVGQVIMFGRDFDVKFVVADNWGDFLLAFANDLIVGNWYLLSDNDYGDILSGEGELVFRDKQHNSTIVEDYMTVLKKRSWVAWKKRVDQQQANTVNKHNPQPQPMSQQQRYTPQSKDTSKVVTKKNKDIVVHKENPRRSISDDIDLDDVAQTGKPAAEPLLDTSVEILPKDGIKTETVKQEETEPVKQESIEEPTKQEAAETTVPVKEAKAETTVSQPIEANTKNEAHEEADLLDDKINEQKPTTKETNSSLENEHKGEFVEETTETEPQSLKEPQEASQNASMEEPKKELSDINVEKVEVEKAIEPSSEEPQKEEITDGEETSEIKEEDQLAENFQEVAL